MSDTLIVPIAAQALVVFDEQKKLNLSSRFDAGSILGQSQQYDLNALFGTDGVSSFEKGVHLHWRLPKILKHGIAHEDNSGILFPAVPNRWLVVRYQTNIDNADKIPTKIWVVKSDVVKESDQPQNWATLESTYEQSPNAQSNSVQEVRQFVFKTIGIDLLLEEQQYSETTGDAAIDLTGVGSINPYFSMIYDESKNVFGFHDTMDGVNVGDTFSYVVTGWYSDPKNDPLTEGAVLDAQLVAKIKSKWDGIEAGKSYKSLLTHTLYNVKWNNQGTGIPSADVNICIGQTSYEPLSAYLREVHQHADFPADTANKETYLNALFNLFLEDESEEKSLEKLILDNHAKQFMPKRRGVLWEIKKIEKDNAQEKEDKTPFFPQDNKLVADLKTLNKHQVDYNQQNAALLSLRQEYYFYWYKIVVAHTEKRVEGIKIEALENAKAGLENTIKDIETVLNTLQASIVDAIAKIAQNKNIKIPKKETPQNDPNTEYLYELMQINEDLFWQPNEPSLLLYGDGLGDMSKCFQDAKDKLKCRLSSQIIEKIYLENKDISINSAKVFSLAAAGLIHDDDIKKLVYEALILDPTLAAFSAIEAHGSGDKNSPIIQNLVSDHVLPAQLKSQKDLLESFAIGEHEQAWEPIFMLWKVGFTPKNQEKEIICQGLSPITEGVAQVLKDLELDTSFGQILSQNLSGFYKQLLAQTSCLQLPPLDYTMKGGFFGTELKIDDKALKIIGNQTEVYAVAPNPSQAFFAPLGEGAITIHFLSLVDSFGQQKIVASDKVTKNMVLSQNLGGGKKNTLSPLPLPKRMIQPTRLRFDWVNSEGDVLYQDTGKMDHPIVGWLVPNFLDNRVMVYDNKGHEVKSIKRMKDQTFAEYYPSKTETLDTEELRTKRESELDPSVKKLIEHLDIKQFLTDAKNLKPKQTQSKAPLSSSAVSMLYGAPFAIAKGKISVERLGNDIKDPRWHATEGDTGDLKDLTINLQIGQNKQNNDGLLGYFLGEDYEKPYLHPSTDVVLNPNQKDIPITVIMSSNIGFYIASDDLLPTQYVQLFPHAVEELTKDIKVSFMLCPFMSNQQQTYIPTPNTPEATWNWIHRASVTTWEKPNDINKSNQQAAFDFFGQQLYEGWVKMDDFSTK